MSYYKGDWYRGDWYRGDPGFWSTIGSISKVASSFIPGGQIVGPVSSSLIGKVFAHTPIAAAAGKSSALTSLASKGIAAVKGHPILSAAGGAGLIAGGAGALGHQMGVQTGMVAGHKGFHMSKPRKGSPAHLVRNRRMNVCNPRALRRSIRRAHGFAKLAMKTIHIVHPKKKGRFGGFRRRRTRARS